MALKESLGFTVLSLLLPCLLLGLQAGCKTNPPTAAELQRLQGTREGVEVGIESNGTVSLTITGHSLHFQEQHAKQWHEATFTLAAEANPQQLRATMTGRGIFLVHIRSNVITRP